MQISKTGLELIKSFEGCGLVAYKCPAGVWTIGYGHTGGVKPGMEINQAQATVMLKRDMRSYEATVNKYVTVEINQNQFDALVSFTYNCGGNALRKSTLLKLLNQGKIKEAADQFDLWNRGGGKVLPGLVRRRTAEKKLFLSQCVTGDDRELSDAVRVIIKSGISIEYDEWKRTGLIKLENVPTIVCKLAGIKLTGSVTSKQYKEAIDKLVLNGVISQRKIWDNKTYTVNNVRSLILKFAKCV